MKDLAPDPKRKAIQTAAWDIFATYGFRKTSMDDIARRAGMSRPAIYLHYRNKEDIFRSLVQYYYDTACEDVQAALATKGSPTEILNRAFTAQMGQGLEALFGSPHGHELLDAGAQIAMDVKEAGEARLAALYANWLQREAAAGRITCHDAADKTAETISVSLRGIKMSAGDFETLKTNMSVLAGLLGAGLSNG